MALSKALAQLINLSHKQVVLKLMVFALHASEVAEVGGVYLFVLNLSSSNAFASRSTKDSALL